MLETTLETLRKNVYLASFRRRGTKRILDGGVGTPPKVLEDYMGEGVWPAEPTRG